MQYVHTTPTIDSTPVDSKRPPCGARKGRKTTSDSHGEKGRGGGADDIPAWRHESGRQTALAPCAWGEVVEKLFRACSQNTNDLEAVSRQA